MQQIPNPNDDLDERTSDGGNGKLAVGLFFMIFHLISCFH